MMMKYISLFFIFLIQSVHIYSQKLAVTDIGSKVNFLIKNFGINTSGSFTGLKGSINFDPTVLNTSSFAVSVNAASVNTNNTTRDKHLKKEAYFNIEKYPIITFTSTKIIKGTIAGKYYMYGNVTIKGITNALIFSFNAVPLTNGYLFTGEFEINRRNFGVGGSSVALADNLKVMLSILATK
jgi:polyisoprenoid-binding protein YceI